MKFTDIFVNKPVLAIVVSLFILLFGLRSFTELNVRQYPELRNAVVNISTTYYGADADLIQGFITTPLEREVASAEGIEYLSSTSSAGVSIIQAYIKLDQDPNEALTQIAANCWPCCRSITGASDSCGSWPRILLTLAEIWVSASFGSWSRRM